MFSGTAMFPADISHCSSKSYKHDLRSHYLKYYSFLCQTKYLSPSKVAEVLTLVIRTRETPNLNLGPLQ